MDAKTPRHIVDRDRATTDIKICFESPETEDARSLIQQLDEDILRRYPGLETTHGLSPGDLNDPKFAFVVARIDGSAVACGALRSLEPNMSEVKRMFVLPQFRGRGIARRVLDALERRAREFGHAAVRLETGEGQPEAIALYKSAGYRKIPGFGEYADNLYSVCFEKPLFGEGFTVRRATERDAEAILAVLEVVAAERVFSAIDQPWSIDQERSYLRSLSPREATHVAITDPGHVVGFQNLDLWAAAITSMKHVGQLGTFLLPEWRRRGVGHALFQMTQSFAQEAGYSKFVIQVRATNASAQAFYQRLGFRECGRLTRQVRIDGQEDDEIMMERFL